MKTSNSRATDTSHRPPRVLTVKGRVEIGDKVRRSQRSTVLVRAKAADSCTTRRSSSSQRLSPRSSLFVERFVAGVRKERYSDRWITQAG